MARGWESKSVEAQQEEAGREGAVKPAGPSTESLERATRREVLLLARSRTARDLKKASTPAQQTMLTRALEDLDRTISELG
jgi:hypothetical protein